MSMETDARALVHLHAAAVAADHNAAQDTTRADVEASLAAHRALDAACERFRRRYFPNAYSVVAVFGEVYTRSRTGRSMRLVWSEKEAGQ